MGRLRKNPNAREILSKNSNYILNPIELKSKWNSDAFKNKNEIEIEIGSGKGIFITTKAIKEPNKNFIAIDKYESILVKLIKKVNDKTNNLKVFSYDAKELENVFDKNEISKIYLNFSDPWPKSRHDKRRLTYVDFLKVYKKILKEDGLIEFKTDNIDFFKWTVEHISELGLDIEYISYDLHSENVDNIMTEYEKKFSEKGTKINKLVFNLKKLK